MALAGCVPAFAQVNPDLMNTPQCHAARKQLDEAFAAGSPRERLIAAREQAALGCLGVKPPAAVAVPRPLAVTICDAAGCWDSNGTHYNQQGPLLMGPRGVCTVQGGVLNCP